MADGCCCLLLRWLGLACSAALLRVQGTAYSVSKVSKNGLSKPFIYNTIILPRQARDKHRENSKKRVVAFFAGCYDFVDLFRGAAILRPGGDLQRRRPVLRLRCEKNLFLSAFPMFVPSLSWQNDRFYT
jgi:hypothetical protein